MMLRNKALFHERLLYLSNHPLVMVLGKIMGRLARRVYLPGIGYIVNDLALADLILNDSRFTSAGQGGMGGMITPVVGLNALINMDGPRHRELKQKLTALFSRKYISQVLDETLAEILVKLKADLENGLEVDLVEVVHNLTNRMTCHMLGLKVDSSHEAEVYREISEVAGKLTSLMKFEKLKPDPADLVKARHYYEKLLSFADFDSSGGLESNVLLHRLQSLGLSQEETKGLVAVILLAGTETVSAALPRIVALLLDSGQFQELTHNRARLPEVIDEGLRLVCASPAILRGVEIDLELAGLPFKKDRRVVVLLYTILKQPDYFDQPRRFQPGRHLDRRAKNLWFGDGPHFCLGYLLAQQEIGAVLNVLIEVAQQEGAGKLKIVRRGYPRGQSFPGYTRLILRLEK